MYGNSVQWETHQRSSSRWNNTSIKAHETIKTNLSSYVKAETWKRSVMVSRWDAYILTPRCAFSSCPEAGRDSESNCRKDIYLNFCCECVPLTHRLRCSFWKEGNKTLMVANILSNIGWPNLYISHLLVYYSPSLDLLHAYPVIVCRNCCGNEERIMRQSR